MDANIFTITGLVLLIVAGFFVTASVLYGIERLIDRSRSLSRGDRRQEEASIRGPATYGPDECYRDCVKGTYPYSEGQYPSCTEACGLTK
jgi:hypothetical protein